MQANNVAQYQLTGKTPVTDTFGVTQNNKSCIESAFAELFSHFQKSQDTGSYYNDMWAMTGSTSSQTLNNSDTDRNRQVQSDHYREDTGSNIEQNRSKETEGYSTRETSRPEDGADKVDSSGETGDDRAVHDYQAEAGAKAGESAEGSETKEAGEDAADVAATLIQCLLESPQSQKLDLSEETRSQLKSILQELKNASSKDEQDISLAKLKDLLKSDPALERILSVASKQAGQLQKQAAATASELKNMLFMVDPDFKMEYKKGSKASQIEREDGSKSNLSSLESASSTFGRLKFKADMENGEKNQNNSKDASLKQTDSRSGEAAASKNGSLHAGETRVLNQNSETGTFKKTMTGTEQRADTTIHLAKQGRTSQGAEKTAAKTSGQETIIKNFQEVKALLDKQLMQVKETSSSSMSIKLNPQELGKINIQLELLENGKLQGKIFVENEITKNSLQQNAEALKEQIKAQGVRLESFEISLKSDNPQQGMKEFYQQEHFDRHSDKSRHNAYSDFQYDEEMSSQLESAVLQGSLQNNGLNVLV